MYMLEAIFLPLNTRDDSWLYGPRRGGAWRERVGEKDQVLSPKAVSIGFRSIWGKKYTAEKCILGGLRPANFQSCTWPAGHPP